MPRPRRPETAESDAGSKAAQTPRQCWTATLAKARPQELADRMDDVGVPAYELLRRPEAGLVMVRGRAGGTGAPFNLGEMTVTRCVVRLHDGVTGFAYVAGRNERHAELAAVADAMLQADEGLHDRLVAPLAAAAQARRRDAAEKAAATRVDFFTMVRGEDPK